MSNLTKHAKNELNLAGLFDKDSDYGGELAKAVMELIEVFSKQGHSGASANRVISLFKKVALYENLTALTGKDEEWNNEIDETTYQNNRVCSVFRKNNKAYYLDAIVWQGPDSWDSFSGTINGITSRQYIKSFPFQPKTFRIDVLREDWDEEKHGNGEWDKVECGPGPAAYKIKDKKQLDAVFEYYNKFEEIK